MTFGTFHQRVPLLPIQLIEIHCIAGTIHPESFYNVLLHVVPIALTNVLCSGNENTISECSFDIYDDNKCDHFDDAIVNCNSK